jgi:alkyl hydroperoxide reductase subunit F
MYDLAIIGGGPAGVAAGVYASRKLIKTIFIAAEFGGQSIVSPDIQNWIGTVTISGDQLAKDLEEHLKTYAGDVVEIDKGSKVTNIEKKDDYFVVTTDKDKTYEVKTVLVATGSTRRKLKVPGAEEFDNKGLTYCATCDGPLFTDKDVVVVGGGNAAFESAAQLLAYCKSVTLINRSDTFRADEVTVKKVLSHPNMTAIKNVDMKEVKGETFVNGLVYTDKESGKDVELKTDGIFVEIGLIPTTSFASEAVELNDHKQVVVDAKNQRTKTDGIWAAGDCTDGLYHQNNIAAGDAVKALEDIYNYLHTQ